LLKAIAVAFVWLVAACPPVAEAKLLHISCETVRTYVAQVGLEQARAVAIAHGMTAWQERLALRCLRG
jgi:hypothetical protein